MTERWTISDHHFGHSNILTFCDYDGKPTRQFDSPDQMDEYMVEMHNSVVKEGDVVYFLGDVAIPKRGLLNLEKMNGSKRLIMGNHDIHKVAQYKKYFKELYGYRVMVDDFIMSHIPLHPDCVTKRFVCNVHGHLHTNEIKMENPLYDEWINEGEGKAPPGYAPDPRYLCVCVEQPWVNYTPLNLDDARQLITKRFEDVGWVKPTRGEDNGGTRLD